MKSPLTPGLTACAWSSPGSYEGCWRFKKIIQRVSREFGVGENEDLVCLSGFRNVRQVFDWKGLKLELGETIYDFGTSYEIECD